MATADSPDVIGYEWEAARRVMDAAGLSVEQVVVGDISAEGPLRVIRQRRQGRVMTLTCAREQWQIVRP